VRLTEVMADAGDRLTEPAPAERLGAARVLIGGYALVYLSARLPHLLDLGGLPADRWQPVGVLEGLDGRPGGGLGALVLAATLIAGVGFTAGWRWRLCGPAFALGTLAATTYGASFGHALHTENLLVLHLLVLAASPCADAWSVDARRGRRRSASAPSFAAARYGFPLRLAALITALTYAVAGWAKLRNGGLGWLDGDVLRNQVAYDNLRKVVFGDPWSPLGAALVGHAWVWPPLAWATLAVEFGAPLALLRPRWSYVWAGAAWLFHLGTLALMAILFPYPLSGAAFVPLLPLERMARRSRATLSRTARTVAARLRPDGAGARPTPSGAGGASAGTA
jgi:hypothetical protein